MGGESTTASSVAATVPALLALSGFGFWIGGIASSTRAQIVDTSTCRLAQVVLSALGTDTLGVSADSTT